MRQLLQTRATLAWLVLSCLTVFSWLLGTDHGFGTNFRRQISVAVLAVAIFKIRLIGLDFMELRASPRVLRMIFEGYCVALFVLLTSMFLFA